MRKHQKGSGPYLLYAFIQGGMFLEVNEGTFWSRNSEGANPEWIVGLIPECVCILLEDSEQSDS